MSTIDQSAWVPTKLINKPYIAVTLCNFCLLLTFYMMMSNVTIITQGLGATKVQAGMASSLFVFGALVSRLWAGPTFDKMGMRKLLFIGLIVYLITCGFYFAAQTLDILLGVRFLHGLGYGVATTVISASIMRTIPKDRLGEGISWYSNSITIGGAIGPSVGIMALGAAGPNGVYVICFIMTLLCVLIGTQVPNLRPALSKEQLEAKAANAPKEPFSLNKIFVKTALVASILSMLIVFAYQNVMSFTLVYSKEIGAYSYGQYYFVLQAIIILIARAATAKILDKHNENWILLWTLPLFAIGMFTFAFAQSGIWIVLGAIPIGIGMGVSHPVMQTLAVQMSKPENLGKATGTFYALMDFGKIIGPMAFGWAATGSYRTGWLFLGGVAILLVLVYVFMHARKVAAGTVVYLNKKKKEIPVKKTTEATA